MSVPARFDFTWVRGTTTPFVFAVKRNGVPIPFDDVRLSVYKNRGRELAFRVSYTDGEIIIVDPSTGLMRFTPQAAQTRGLTPSRDGVTPLNSYELEYRNGASEEVHLIGDIVGFGGLNDDEQEDAS